MSTIKLTLLFLTISVFVFAACTETGTNTATNSSSKPTNSATVAANTSPEKPASAAADGKELYSTKCMICHKDNGKGGKVTVEGKNLHPADLTSDKFRSRPDEKLAEMIKEGDPDEGMPAFKDKLSAQEISAIVTYVRTLQQ